jgi:hypothetical protein
MERAFGNQRRRVGLLEETATRLSELTTTLRFFHIECE